VNTQMPDLVARLSGLHATLTTRLTLQDSLLSLNGRLDMVLSQIEMRSSAAPAPLALQKGKVLRNAQGKPEPGKYIEGESEDEENVQMDVEVEMESDDDAGSIEDVELGGESQEDEDEDEDEEDGDEEDDSDDEGPTLNGFIDDEAEEVDSDEDDESE
jgi:U3 small nucleolar RNA-associated protein 5